MNDETDNARISALFPRASKSFIDANAGLFTKEPQRDLRPTVVDQAPREEEGDARIIVSIVMFRVRLLDTDNAYGSAKPLIDCLRTCGLIPDDTEKAINLKVTQEKVAHFNEQRTEVKITYGQSPSETIQNPTE